MAFLIEVLKGLVIFIATCVGLGVLYLVFTIASEVSWTIKQENRKQYEAKQKEGDGK